MTWTNYIGSNPKHLKAADVAGVLGETVLSEKPVRVWGVACRWNGTSGAFGTLILRNDNAAGASTPKAVFGNAPAAAAGQGFGWFEPLYGMYFPKGLTAQNVNAGMSALVLYEESA